MPGAGNQSLRRTRDRRKNAGVFRPRPRLAWFIALAADALQLAVFPVFGPGFASPANNILDVSVAVLMSTLLGWHWAFLPTFFAELVPFVGLVPTWTLACFIATRRLRKRGQAPGPPGPPGPPALGRPGPPRS